MSLQSFNFYLSMILSALRLDIPPLTLLVQAMFSGNSKSLLHFCRQNLFNVDSFHRNVLYTIISTLRIYIHTVTRSILIYKLLITLASYITKCVFHASWLSNCPLSFGRFSNCTLPCRRHTHILKKFTKLPLKP